MTKHDKKWSLEKRAKPHTYLVGDGWVSVTEVAQQLDVTHALVSNMTAKALRKVAGLTLKGMGVRPDAEKIDELAFNEAFIDVIVELLKERPVYSAVAIRRAKAKGHV